MLRGRRGRAARSCSAEHVERDRRGARAARDLAASGSASVPSYYLRYFYAHDEVVRELRAEPVAGRRGGRDRAASCWSCTPTRPLDEKPDAAGAAGRRLLLRGGGRSCARRCSGGRPGGERRAGGQHCATTARCRSCPTTRSSRCPRGSTRDGAVPAAGRRRSSPLYRRAWSPHVTAYEHLALDAALHGGTGAGLRGAARAPAGRPGRPRRRPDRPAARPQPGRTWRGRDVAAPTAESGVLAIDAGNSKTDVAARRGGRHACWAAARGGGFRPHVVGAGRRRRRARAARRPGSRRRPG